MTILIIPNIIAAIIVATTGATMFVGVNQTGIFSPITDYLYLAKLPTIDFLSNIADTF
jgi:hypothetical protein